jgi:hypothetical protein
MPDEALKIFNDFPVKREPAEWALKWLWNQPAVTMVLSGMKNLQNMETNIRVCNDSLPDKLDPDELRVFGRVMEIFRSRQYVPCTGCGYCVPCPRGVDIPQCVDLYNQRAQMNYKSSFVSKRQAWVFYVMRTLGANAGRCNGCRACEPKCPQGIKIADEMKQVRKKMEGVFYRPISYLLKKFMKR